jgi:hypothetical protein
MPPAPWRHQHARRADELGHLREPVHDVALVAQVELLRELHREPLDGGRHRREDAHRDEPGESPHERSHEAEVGGHESGAGRSEDLHRDVGPVEELTAVDDGQRRRREGDLVEAAEHLLERSPEVGLHDPTNLVERHGRTVVEHASHGVGQGLAGDAGRGG